MNRTAVIALSLFCLSGFACSSSGNSTGAGGTTGGAGTTGAAGTGAAGTGAAGTSGSFTSVQPCTTEGSYTQGTTTITFGAATDVSYMPKCLEVSPGTSVTFSGDFSMHPLMPSALRGAQSGNPITATSTGTSKSFTFSTAGYYAYYCTVHGASDGAAGMVGVIWVH
jgi:plastocyanin